MAETDEAREARLARHRAANARSKAKDPEKHRRQQREAKARYKARHKERVLESARRQSQRYRANNPEKVKAALKRWHLANADHIRGSWLQAKYGLTLEDWNEKFASQGRVCGCCSSAEPGAKGWQTDHDHGTGRLRDILCGACNKGLGIFEDSPERLKKALFYLDRHGKG